MFASVRQLLGGIVDYAGLFPPAQLDMQQAAQNYAQYLQHPQRFMLARFVVPVGRLDELAESTLGFDFAEPWPLSVLIGDDLTADFGTLAAFNERYPDRFAGTMIEVKADSAERIAKIATSTPMGTTAYVEIPYVEDPDPLIATIREHRLSAKARTGGVTAAAFPTAEDLSRFVLTCYRHDAPFKATAGLHHPVRAEHGYTYEPDTERGMMHGFLNVFLAAAFCYNGLTREDAPELLLESDPDVFVTDENGIAWRHYRVTTKEIEKVRRRLARSFGSCSFTEPADDLSTLGWI